MKVLCAKCGKAKVLNARGQWYCSPCHVTAVRAAKGGTDLAFPCGHPRTADRLCKLCAKVDAVCEKCGKPRTLDAAGRLLCQPCLTTAVRAAKGGNDLEFACGHPRSASNSDTQNRCRVCVRARVARYYNSVGREKRLTDPDLWQKSRDRSLRYQQTIKAKAKAYDELMERMASGAV